MKALGGPLQLTCNVCGTTRVIHEFPKSGVVACCGCGVILLNIAGDHIKLKTGVRLRGLADSREKP